MIKEIRGVCLVFGVKIIKGSFEVKVSFFQQKLIGVHESM